MRALLAPCARARVQFARFAQRQFVDDNPHLKYCPAVGCEMVLKATDLSVTEAKCSCGMVRRAVRSAPCMVRARTPTEGRPRGGCAWRRAQIFCFRCSREVHFPMSCALAARWEDRIKSDAADGQWIQANSRRCQKCHAHIEKNGGCNWSTWPPSP